MKVISVTSGERVLFSGNMLECLIKAREFRKTTRYAVVIESDNLKRITIARQEEIYERLFK